jgi:hypothetical protein
LELHRHRCQRRRVAPANVFGQRLLHGGADFSLGQFHIARMGVIENAEKKISQSMN